MADRPILTDLPNPATPSPRRRPLTLDIVSASWFQPDWSRCLASWHTPTVSTHIVDHLSILDAYQLGYERTTTDLIAYLHDDLLCLDPDWLAKVQNEFADPAVAIVGFAGAPSYGASGMYSVPYHHSSLGRVGFRSNLANAEQHGARFTGSCDVAVLDGLALIVRREFLNEIGGWRFPPPIGYYMYTEFLCFTALRYHRKIRLVGVACDHLSGRSTGLNPNLNPDFEGEHRRLWEEFRDLLPVRVGDSNGN